MARSGGNDALRVRADMLTAREVWIRRRAAGIHEEQSEEAEAAGLIVAEDGRNLARLVAVTEAIAKGLSGGG